MKRRVKESRMLIYADNVIDCEGARLTLSHAEALLLLKDLAVAAFENEFRRDVIQVRIPNGVIAADASRRSKKRSDETE